MSKSTRVPALALLVALTGGCSNGTEPSDLVAGSYTATTFTLSGDVSGDVLAAGGSLTITLAENLTTAGSLFVPASLNEGQDLTADMAGTWTLTGDIVRFTQTADTFVRDIEWQVGNDRLSGSGTFSEVTITVVLTRVNALF